MDRQLRILLLEDSAADAELIRHELKRGGLACVTARVETEAELLAQLREFVPDVVLSDFTLPSWDGMSALAITRKSHPDLPFIFVSGTIGEERAIEALKQGATDYVLKTNLSRLATVVRRSLEEARERAARKKAETELMGLAARLADTQETERRNLARELHDRVGQNLAALSVNLNVMRAQLPPESAAMLGSRIDDCIRLVEETVEQVRDVMAELRPPVLDDYGLMAALRWYSGPFARRTGIVATVSGEEPSPRLPLAVEAALFRIAQEALTNVAKHACARRVSVNLGLKPTGVVMTIVDDGIGFDPTLARSRERQGWGLLSMHERAQVIGGRLEVRSAPGQGAQVIVEVSR